MVELQRLENEMTKIQYNPKNETKYSSTSTIDKIKKVFDIPEGPHEAEGINNAIYKLYLEDIRDY